MVSPDGELKCPRCEKPIEWQPASTENGASTAEKCCYRCADCGWAFSNPKKETSGSKIRRVAIAPTPELNVPPEARDGLTAALEGAINIHNRLNKRDKFCSENSEDAVTWTVFQGLRHASPLSGVLEGEGEPSLILWGVPICGPLANSAADRLIAISDKLGENSKSRTEPDVIVAWSNVIAFIEVKYRSPNDIKPNYKHFDKYLRGREDLFRSSPAEIKKSGFYELVRNWRIGAELAEQSGRRFELINLGPDGLKKSSDNFGSQVAQSETGDDSAGRKYTFMSWSNLLAGAELPPWLRDYARAKKLLPE